MPASEEALTFKKRGNEAFAKHEWLNAIDFYTQAIESYSDDPTFFCNRCQVNTLAYPVEGVRESRLIYERRTLNWSNMATQSSMLPKPLSWITLMLK